jgi:hypothetical protein
MQYCIYLRVDALVRLLPTRDHTYVYPNGGDHPTPREHGITPPVCLRHRGQQAHLVRSTTVEPDRRAHADDRHRE